MYLEFNNVARSVKVSIETYRPTISLELENAYLKSIIGKYGTSLEGYAAVSMESGILETIKNFFKRIKEWIFGGNESTTKEIKKIEKKVAAKSDAIKKSIESAPSDVKEKLKKVEVVTEDTSNVNKTEDKNDKPKIVIKEVKDDTIENIQNFLLVNYDSMVRTFRQFYDKIYWLTNPALSSARNLEKYLKGEKIEERKVVTEKDMVTEFSVPKEWYGREFNMTISKDDGGYKIDVTRGEFEKVKIPKPIDVLNVSINCKVITNKIGEGVLVMDSALKEVSDAMDAAERKLESEELSKDVIDYLRSEMSLISTFTKAVKEVHKEVIYLMRACYRLLEKFDELENAGRVDYLEEKGYT